MSTSNKWQLLWPIQYSVISRRNCTIVLNVLALLPCSGWLLLLTVVQFDLFILIQMLSRTLRRVALLNVVMSKGWKHMGNRSASACGGWGAGGGLGIRDFWTQGLLKLGMRQCLYCVLVCLYLFKENALLPTSQCDISLVYAAVLMDSRHKITMIWSYFMSNDHSKSDCKPFCFAKVSRGGTSANVINILWHWNIFNWERDHWKWV